MGSVEIHSTAYLRQRAGELTEEQAAKLHVSRAGGQAAAAVEKPGPVHTETMAAAAKLQVSRSGGQGVAVVKKPVPGLVETMV